MKRGTSALAVAAVAVTLAVPTSGGAASTDAPADVIVSARDASALPAGARFVAELAPGLRTYLLRVPDGKSAKQYSRDLRANPDIFGAQPNAMLQRAKLASACADPPSVNAAQSLAAAVGAVTVAGGPAAPVAVLDTGIDPATAELRGRVLPGFNSVNGSTDTSDIDGHGTEVASVVAAAPGRFQGVSPSTQVMPIKIYNHNSATTVDWVVKGIEAAMNRRVPIINLSSSNPAADVPVEDAEVLQQAILAAFAKGTITIVSAGNEGKADQTVPGKLERVITVGLRHRRGHARRVLELRLVGRRRQPGREPDPAGAAERLPDRLRSRQRDFVLGPGGRRRRLDHQGPATEARHPAALRPGPHVRGQGALRARP